MKKFLTLFQDEKAKHAAKEAKLAKDARELEEREHVAAKRDYLLNGIESAKAIHAERYKVLREAAEEYSNAEYASDFLTGFKFEYLAAKSCGRQDLKRRLPALEKELEKLIVSPANKAFADFEKEQKVILSTLPPAQKMEPPPFVPAAPVDDFAIAPLTTSPGVRLMLGLKPGEKLPPSPFETLGGNVPDDGDDD